MYFIFNFFKKPFYLGWSSTLICCDVIVVLLHIVTKQYFFSYFSFFIAWYSTWCSNRIDQWRPWHQKSPLKWSNRRSASEDRKVATCSSRVGSHQIPMSTLFQNLHPPKVIESTHEMPQRFQKILVYLLWQGIQRYFWFETTYANPYRYV